MKNSEKKKEKQEAFVPPEENIQINGTISICQGVSPVDNMKYTTPETKNQVFFSTLYIPTVFSVLCTSFCRF